MRILAAEEEWDAGLEEEGSPGVLVSARVENAFVRNAEKKFRTNGESPATNTNARNAEPQ
jgi:hypothetical protein